MRSAEETFLGSEAVRHQYFLRENGKRFAGVLEPDAFQPVLVYTPRGEQEVQGFSVAFNGEVDDPYADGGKKSIHGEAVLESNGDISVVDKSFNGQIIQRELRSPTEDECLFIGAAFESHPLILPGLEEQARIALAAREAQANVQTNGTHPDTVEETVLEVMAGEDVSDANVSKGSHVVRLYRHDRKSA